MHLKKYKFVCLLFMYIKYEIAKFFLNEKFILQFISAATIASQNVSISRWLYQSYKLKTTE